MSESWVKVHCRGLCFDNFEKLTAPLDAAGAATVKEVVLGFNLGATGRTLRAIFWTVVLNLASDWENVVYEFEHGDFVGSVTDCNAVRNPIDFVDYLGGPAICGCDVSEKRWSLSLHH